MTARDPTCATHTDRPTRQHGGRACRRSQTIVRPTRRHKGEGVSKLTTQEGTVDPGQDSPSVAQ